MIPKYHTTATTNFNALTNRYFPYFPIFHFFIQSSPNVAQKPLKIWRAEFQQSNSPSIPTKQLRDIAKSKFEKKSNFCPNYCF